MCLYMYACDCGLWFDCRSKQVASIFPGTTVSTLPYKVICGLSYVIIINSSSLLILITARLTTDQFKPHDNSSSCVLKVFGQVTTPYSNNNNNDTTNNILPITMAWLVFLMLWGSLLLSMGRWQGSIQPLGQMLTGRCSLHLHHFLNFISCHFIH